MSKSKIFSRARMAVLRETWSFNLRKDEYNSDGTNGILPHIYIVNPVHCKASSGTPLELRMDTEACMTTYSMKHVLAAIERYGRLVTPYPLVVSLAVSAPTGIRPFGRTTRTSTTRKEPRDIDAQIWVMRIPRQAYSLTI